LDLLQSDGGVPDREEELGVLVETAGRPQPVHPLVDVLEGSLHPSGHVPSDRLPSLRWASLVVERPFSQGGRALVVAHRGDPSASPENTLAAFEDALAAGADAVEFDVRLSADGFPVVIHDAFVDRTTGGVGPVRSMGLFAL